MTDIHVGGKEKDGSRLKVVWDDDLRVLAVVIPADSHLGSGQLDQFRWDAAVSVGLVFPLVEMGADRCATQVGDLCAAQLGGLDYWSASVGPFDCCARDRAYSIPGP